ncbi:MAG: bifunctional phosphopantothenoylcysteine decarboxylase/phosphopantothenate--cysteine ligase CoaBC [Pseudomonadota bacterium]
MQRLANRRIVLGVTGGIAAYKSAELVRLLKKAGADVRVVMTRGGQAFITPLTLQALSGNPVHTDLLDPAAEAAMGHIELARWADLVLIAPATADFIARLAGGSADDLLSTLCLATAAPIAIAPAMNQGMYRDPATQANLALLAGRGVHRFGPDDGDQACGDIGPGRMLEPAGIAAAAAGLFQSRLLDGVRVLLTAGPTREAIDPVRYVSNHSTGKMGFSLARACVDAGAQVTLVCGPVHLATPERVTRVDVVSARDMHAAVLARAEACDIFIGTAAVADYTPAECADRKIKKTAGEMTIRMIRNPDIIGTVAALARKPFTVGFAAETNDVVAYGRDKLARKQLDMIVANDVSNPAIGFGSDDNAVTVIWPDGHRELAAAGKPTIARQLVELVAAQYRRNNPPTQGNSAP